MSNKDYTAHTKESLIEHIQKLESNYGLVWEAETEAEQVVKDCLENKPILTESKKQRIHTGDKEVNHWLIEGDNYHALSALGKTHTGKVDLIYIDPPYNTGSNEFAYSDRFIEKKDAYPHSKWLNFISKRLLLAHDLLNDKGAIFISINEEEQAHLKLLCDKIFGLENYLAMFTIKVRHPDRILKGDKDFHEVAEYLFLYRKSNAFKPAKRKIDNTSIDEYVYEVKELTRKPAAISCGKKQVQVFKPGQYEIVKSKASDKKLKKINIRGSLKEGNSSGRFFMKHLNQHIGKKLGYLYKVPGMGDDGNGHRYFLLPEKLSNTNGNYFQGVPLDKPDVREIPYPNFFDFEHDFNNVGYEGGVEFRNGKKPLNFLLKCFEIAGLNENKNATVLDFFAGSGSTGHALLQLNKNDGGNRQAILCTNNENNICSNVTCPRLKKAIEGYTAGKQVFKPLGGNLQYFKTAFAKAVKVKKAKGETWAMPMPKPQKGSA